MRTVERFGRKMRTVERFGRQRETIRNPAASDRARRTCTVSGESQCEVNQPGFHRSLGDVAADGCRKMLGFEVGDTANEVF